MKGKTSARRLGPLRFAILAPLLSCCIATTVLAGPFDTWNCHMPVTVTGYKDYESLVNFPLLVVLNTNLVGFNYKQFGYSDGRDLRFTDASGNTELTYEVDHWDNKGNSYIWVKIPILQGIGNTNYFEGQWVKNWSWTGEPILARIYNGNILWGEHHMDAGAKRFADPGWMGADSYPIRYQSLFADQDPATGWTYADRAPLVTTRPWNTDGELIGTWMYEVPPLSDRQIFVRFHNGFRYAAKADGSFWAAAMFGVLIDAQTPSLYVTNKADMLAFCDFDPRTTANPYDAPVYTTNLSPVKIIAHWGNPSTTLPSYTTNGSMWSGNSMAGVWHMREAAAKDAKRNAADGTPNNITVTNGRFGSGLSFNSAQNSSINFGTFTPGFVSNDSYTIEGWFYRTANSGANVVYGNSANLQAAGLGVDGNGKYTSIHNGTDETMDNSSYGNGQWQHVMLVHRSGGNDSFNDLLYINGQYVNSRGNSSGSGGPEHNTATIVNVPASGSLSFGRSPWGTDYCGNQIMDEIRIHKTERTWNWVQATYKTMVSNNTFQTYSSVQGLTNTLYGGTNPPGAFQFASSTYSVNETGRYVDVTVQRPLDAGSNVTVHVSNNGGNAVAGTDYVAVDATLAMGDGVNTAVLRVYIANNALDDGNRTISLTLDNPTGGASITAPSTTTITIQDDDASTQANILLPYGSLWKYFATNVSADPGASWAATNFNDSAWSTGPAPLGYNTSAPDETTTILSYGSDSANKIPAYYVRKAITIADPSAVGLLTLKARIDDGCLMFINGTEVSGARYLMTNGTVTYQSYATNGAPNGKPELIFTASASLLRAGTNIIAVEVHQVGASSSDVFVDIQIEATTTSTNSEFVAYNDIGWVSGQTTTNITILSPAGTTSGTLVDYNSGSPLSVQASINCDVAGAYVNNAANLTGGTPAEQVFNGKVATHGYFNWSMGTVTITLSNLDPAKQYSFALFGSRGDANYTYRWCDVRISDAAAFANNSSAGTTLSTVSMPNDQGRILAANTEGRIWKYDAIQPGPDGDVSFTVTSGGSTSTGGYLNAFMLQTYTNVSGDGDSDGMDDIWEQTYFGGTGQANAGTTQDWDNDGFDNYSEYRAGTDPTAPGSRLEFSNAASAAGNGVVLTWSSATGKTYSVQQSTNLMAAWNVLVSGIAATPPLNVHTASASQIHGYIRVKVE